MKIRNLINPIARAMLRERRPKQIIPNKKKGQAKRVAESKIKEYKKEGGKHIGNLIGQILDCRHHLITVY